MDELNYFNPNSMYSNITSERKIPGVGWRLNIDLPHLATLPHKLEIQYIKNWNYINVDYKITKLLSLIFCHIKVNKKIPILPDI